MKMPLYGIEVAVSFCHFLRSNLRLVVRSMTSNIVVFVIYPWMFFLHLLAFISVHIFPRVEVAFILLYFHIHYLVYGLWLCFNVAGNKYTVATPS